MGETSGAGRYRAFISYSHRDAAFGRRLHRRLEAYALPRRLVGRDTPRGPAPARIAPVFRDLEELPAADDLSAEVRAALADSATLIVVCSPAAAASPWVAREIETFRALHPGRPILAALIAGDPADAFPEPLRLPGSDGRPVEPLAADFRPGLDGERHALLKLVAGVTGIGLDELVQRDAQRRLRSVTAVTAVAVTAMLAMALLTTFAFQARAEADRQRAEAEGLVDFMQTDLRAKLKEVGRLDVLTAVNARALDYYKGQDLKRLPPASLERRAGILQAMGEDDMRRGDLEGALRKFKETRRTTEALLRDDPRNSKRMFAHSQSEYWVGYVAYERGQVEQARAAFDAYQRLASALAAAEPRNAVYLKEAAYAEGALCSIALAEPPNVPAALKRCAAALERMEQAAARTSPAGALDEDLANRHAWLADAHRANGDPASTLVHRLAEERLLAPRLASDPRNMRLRERWIALQRALAALDLKYGRPRAATERLRKAHAVMGEMIAFDPTNRTWAKQRQQLTADIAVTSAAIGKRGTKDG